MSTHDGSVNHSETQQVPLRLVRPEQQDIIPLERRSDHRKRVTGRVTALRATSADPEARNRICPLQLINMSEGGLAALSQEPVEVDVSIAVFFPPHGPDQGFDLLGRVVRCTPREYGHEIAIRFENAGQHRRHAG